MELNRNHYFAAGILFILLGFQFRSVESFVLNEKASQYLAQQFSDSPSLASAGPMNVGLFPSTPVAKRTIRPPRWVGLSLISLGAVLLLHSLAMKKPGAG